MHRYITKILVRTFIDFVLLLRINKVTHTDDLWYRGTSCALCSCCCHLLIVILFVLPVKVRLYAMTLLILMMLSATSETSELVVLCICAIIKQRHHVNPVTINPCASLFSLSYSPVHDFQLSNILSAHFACTYLSLQGIHFRHLVVWSPLAPMSLPVTRFFVTAKGTHARSLWQQVKPKCRVVSS